MTASTDADGEMHPLVALMRRYCIDYTNSHDQSTYPDLFEDDYTVHIEGHRLVRDETYGPAAAQLFALAPGLGLVVHELVLNGDRVAMRFSEHGAFPAAGGRRLACWPGIGLYSWNGRRLTGNHVEQDFAGRRRQLDSGVPDPLEAPHLDPWTTTHPVAPDAAAEAVVRAWLAHGRLDDAPRVLIDTTAVTRRIVAGATDRNRADGDTLPDAQPLVVDPQEVTVNDLFSAGPRVAFHVTLHGSYGGGLDGVAPALAGAPLTLHVAGLARVADDGRVEEVQAVTSRRAARATLRASLPNGTGSGGKVLFDP